jgi:hypothetical protein
MLSTLYSDPTKTPQTGLQPVASEHQRQVRSEWIRTWFRGPIDLDNYTLEDQQKRDEYRTLMLKEPAVATAFWSLIGSVMSLPPIVHADDPDNPKSVELAKAVKSWVGDQIEGGWPTIIKNIAAGGLIDGFSVNEMVVDYPERGTWRQNRKLCLVDLAPLDTKYLRFDIDQFKRVQSVRGMKANAGQSFPAEQFAIFTHRSLFGSPVGISLFRGAYRAALVIESAIKLRAILLQNYTGPFLQYKSNSGTSRETAMSIMSEARAMGFVVCDQGDEVTVTSLAASADSEFQAAIDDMRKEIYTAIRGAYLPFTEAAAGAKVGNTSVQRSITQIGEWTLATDIASVINTQIIKPLVRANVADENVGFPRLSLGGRELEETKAQAEIFKTAQSMGVELSKRQVQRALDLEAPVDQDDTLHDPQSQQQQPGLGGLMGGLGGPPGGQQPAPSGPPPPQGGQPQQPAPQPGHQPEADSPDTQGIQPSEMDHAAMLAIVDLQAKAAAEGRPGAYQGAIKTLRGMIGNHDQLISVLGGQSEQFAWMPGQSKGGNIKAIGTGEHQGQTLYGKRAESVLKNHEKTQEVKQESQRRYATVQEAKAGAKAIASKAVMGNATNEDYKQLADYVEHLTVGELRAIRVQIGARFNGATRREGMVKALTEHALKVASGQSTEPEQKPRTPRGYNPAKRAAADEAVTQALVNKGQPLPPEARQALMAHLPHLSRDHLRDIIDEHTPIGGGGVGLTRDQLHGHVMDAIEGRHGGQSQPQATQVAPVASVKPERQATPATDKNAAADPGPSPAVKQPQLRDKLLDAMKASVPSKRHKQYEEGIRKATERMPDKAMQRIGANLGEVKFNTDKRKLTEDATNDFQRMLDGQLQRGEITADEHESSSFARSVLADQFDKFGGMYLPDTGTLHLGGALSGMGDTFHGRHGVGSYVPSEHVYSHELGHALDGKGFAHSSTAEWAAIHAAEFVAKDGEKAPLTNYAATHKSEGFAEFSRLLYASDVPHLQIEQEFPKASAYFKGQGFWPGSEHGNGTATAMPEAFSPAVELPGKSGAHLDVKADPAHASQEGPKDGDKDANGLVFRNGRWHRDDEPVTETQTAGTINPEPSQEPTNDRTERPTVDGTGSPAVQGRDATVSGPVAGETVRPGVATADPEQDSGNQPDGAEAPRSVPAPVERVHKRINRFRDFFRSRGEHQVADWLDALQGHVNAVGVDSALESLGGVAGGDRSNLPQYEGGWDQAAFGPNDSGHHLAGFCANYLNRNGITMMHQEGATYDLPFVSSAAPAFGGSSQGVEGSHTLSDSGLANKLEESKSLPGLESSEDINTINGDVTTHLTPDFMKKLDAKYGEGQWIVKAYGEDAAAGYGIFFPQLAKKIQQDAQNTIWDAGGNIAKYGFSIDRDAKGKAIGIKHESGDSYRFGTPAYERTINGDVRFWGDKVAAASENEHGAQLPGGGKEFMAQPAFKVVGVSDAERAAGKTIASGEGRVHVMTRNGKVEVIPHTTWIKGDHLPVVFESEDTKAMAEAARKAIEALPESERNGQIYAPDIVRAEDGYKVVEANPANHTGSSGYLGNNPLIIDAYVSHIAGTAPKHVQFLRNLMTQRGRNGKVQETDAPATGRPGRQRGSKSRGTGGAENDGPATPRINAEESRTGYEPKRLQDALTTVPRLTASDSERGRWDHGADAIREHATAVLEAAKQSGAYIDHDTASQLFRHGPNRGGHEHEVYLDHDKGRVYKITKNNHFGQNTDLHEYLERHDIANKLWPDLGYKVHGITTDDQGRTSAAVSMNYVAGTHPADEEINDWFRERGWVPADPDDNPDDPWAWKDPESGTIIADTHSGNFLKTAGGLVPIDVDIYRGEK